MSNQTTRGRFHQLDFRNHVHKEIEPSEGQFRLVEFQIRLKGLKLFPSTVNTNNASTL